MYDLSWLNPTPHAIAVYASQPLSPAATQHSLPSGRYPLLGPDFHRLDRTSLRLAHSLDHLVGEREQLVWNIEAQRLGGLEVDHQLEFNRLHHRKVLGLRSIENPLRIDADFAISFGKAHAITHQPTVHCIFAKLVEGGQLLLCRVGNNVIAPGVEERIAHH